MDKKTFFVILELIILAIFISGCTDLTEERPIESIPKVKAPVVSEADQTTTTLIHNPTENQTQQNPYYTRENCADACELRGYESGQCDWKDFPDFAKAWSKDVENIGPCTVHPLENHCGGVQCYCHCYNMNWDNLNVTFRTNFDVNGDATNNTWIAFDSDNDGDLEGMCFSYKYNYKQVLSYFNCKHTSNYNFKAYYHCLPPKEGDYPSQFILLEENDQNIIYVFDQECSIAELSLKSLEPYRSNNQEHYIISRG